MFQVRLEQTFDLFLLQTSPNQSGIPHQSICASFETWSDHNYQRPRCPKLSPYSPGRVDRVPCSYPDLPRPSSQTKAMPPRSVIWLQAKAELSQQPTDYWLSLYPSGHRLTLTFCSYTSFSQCQVRGFVVGMDSYRRWSGSFIGQTLNHASAHLE